MAGMNLQAVRVMLTECKCTCKRLLSGEEDVLCISCKARSTQVPQVCLKGDVIMAFICGMSLSTEYHMV